MNFRDFLRDNIVILDGGMGTLLQKSGIPTDLLPERANILYPDTVRSIHKDYLLSGSNVINTNTFGANVLKFSENELEDVISAAISIAREAIDSLDDKENRFVALDIGPLGKLLKPYGELEFEDAVEIFAKTVRIGDRLGADLIFIETMNDSYETKAALLAAKENSSLPILVSNAYGSDKKLMTGATPTAMAAMLEGMGADAIGANCSLGPKELEEVVEELLSATSLPIILKPNAGMPVVEDGKTVYKIDPEEFSDSVEALVKKGVSLIGGCCGTTPEYIKELSKRVKNTPKADRERVERTLVSSYTYAVEIGKEPILIGERINPTGKKKLRNALIERDFGYILSEAIGEEEKGVHVLDVNVGIPDLSEKDVLPLVIRKIQTVSALPLQIDTSNPEAMEKALRLYNGKAMINSVNGKTESMESVFPLVKKYGGAVVALTLDEKGIPDSIEGRIEIAKRILKRAEEYGIAKKDIIFDTLAMTVSVDNRAAGVTLGALSYIRNILGCNTVLGVSNISFGLPSRDGINSTFFAMALEGGLSAAIMNPFSYEMMRTYYSYRALRGYDGMCKDYIEFSQTEEIKVVEPTLAAKQTDGKRPEKNTLSYAVERGLRDKAAEYCKKMLEDNERPLDIVNGEIIPALDRVGEGFEKGTLFLPSLLMSAEAAKAAFEVIKASSENEKKMTQNGKTVVIATVKGDIHDIGKNIVKLLFENYGYNVVDLGKNVDPSDVLKSVIDNDAKICVLSALMTTTVAAMEETVALVKREAPLCKTIVGGAVLTEEYANKMGADKYAPDAISAVKYAEQI